MKPGVRVGRRFDVGRGDWRSVKETWMMYAPHGARCDTPEQGPGLAPAENERKEWKTTTEPSHP